MGQINSTDFEQYSKPAPEKTKEETKETEEQ